MRLCVIPARGGSKRIKKKNIKNFCGKPIIVWSIKAAIASRCFDKIIVSTDDNEIAKISKSFGVDVPFKRPSNLSDDYTGTVEVVSHAVKWAINNFQKPEYVCCIYSTAPFIKPVDIKNGLKLLKTHKSDYVFSATNFPYPIQRAFRLKRNCQLEMFYPNHYTSRSQDFEEAYHDAGQFYWGLANSWLKHKPILNKKAKPIFLPRDQVHDIDTLDDWRIAEKFFKLFNKKEVIRRKNN